MLRFSLLLILHSTMTLCMRTYNVKYFRKELYRWKYDVKNEGGGGGSGGGGGGRQAM